MSLLALPTRLVSWMLGAFVNTFSLFYEAVLPRKKLYLPPADINSLIKRADAICFDVDSTVISDEGIVSLASVCGVGDEVEKITNSAMSGGISFKQALNLRLDIIKPSVQDVEKLRARYAREMDQVLTPGIRELVQLLQLKGVSVYLVSGGFIQVIEPVADYIGIPRENVFANDLQFDSEGEYVGFDEEQLTCNSGGKGLAVEAIKKFHKTVIMIGDGMTDYEASPPADLFIGFGGNVERKKVKELAPWYIYSFSEIISVLKDQ